MTRLGRKERSSNFPKAWSGLRLRRQEVKGPTLTEKRKGPARTGAGHLVDALPLMLSVSS